jgi:hypothetical protein
LIAILLTVALFVFWSVVGYAVLAFCRRDEGLPNLLLAPVVGVAATLLPIFLINRAGVPVGHLAWLLTPALAAGAGLLLWRLRPALSLRRYGPFAAVLMLALFLTGRPMLQFGFDWLSYCNDDMTNYTLTSQRFMDHGFSDIPQEGELMHGTNYSQFYWFFHVPGMVRPGIDLLLAWVASLTGLMTHQAFMPLILAFHLVLISSAGALVCRSEDQRWPGLLTCGLVGLSALTALGTLYQLIAQVLGLALLAGCAIVLMQPLEGKSRSAERRHGLLTGLLVAALLLVYSEVFPFLAIAFVVYLTVGLCRRAFPLRPLVRMLAIAGLTSVVLLNERLPGPLLFLCDQMKHATEYQEKLISLFPYYLVPRGLANLWGFQPLAGSTLAEPWSSVTIGCGGALLLAGVVASLRLIRELQPAAILTLVMLGVAAALRARPDPYGLYKLAMFIQPFLLATVVTGWFALVRRPTLRFAPLLLLGLAGLSTQEAYVRASRGDSYLFNEVPDASRSGINSEFRREIADKPIHRLLLDSYNYPLLKLQALFLQGIEVTAPSMVYFQNFRVHIWQGFLRPAVREATTSLLAALKAQFKVARFDQHDPAEPGAVNKFEVNMIGRSAAGEPECDYVVASTPKQNVLNRYHFSPEEARAFTVRPWREVSNHLLFIPSELGEHYYVNTGPAERIGLFGLEPDLFFPGQTVAGCGRHLLFQVVHPSPRARLLLNISTTLKADSANCLPPAAAIGTERQVFPLLGRGSARVFSPPLTPQVIDGRAYLAIDMGVEGTRLPKKRTGLMKLFGRKIPLDRRFLTSLARDISLVSEEEYARLEPPSNLAHFPDDLRHPGLEYAGMYEDGWVSDAAFFHLSQPANGSRLVVRGAVPLVGDPAFTTEVQLLVDGREVARRSLKLGKFDIRCEVTPSTGRRRVELRFSKYQHMPEDDRRPVTARLERIGFETPQEPPSSLAHFPDDLCHPGLEYAGMYEDGWVSDAAFFHLSQPASGSTLVVRGMVPLVGDPAFTTEAQLLVDGREVARRSLKLGDFEIRCEVTPTTTRRRVELRFSKQQHLPGNDRRPVSVLLERIGFENPTGPAR